MTTQRKWPTSRLRNNSSNEISRDEILTKLKIFNDKFGIDLPPDGIDTETIRTYYYQVLETIDDNSNKNYSILQDSLQEFVDMDKEDIDEEYMDQEKSGCCPHFWDWFFRSCLIRSCIPHIED